MSDRKATKNLDEFKMIVRRNMIKFRQVYPEFKDVPYVIITETNSRFTGDTVQNMFQSGNVLHDTGTPHPIGSYKFMSDGRRAGITKTFKRTKEYVLYFNFVLDTDAFKLNVKYTTANDRGISSERMAAEGRDELGRFRWPDVDVNNIRVKSRKITGKIGGQNDDLAIVYLMIVYFQFIKRNLEKDVRQIVTNSISQ